MVSLNLDLLVCDDPTCSSEYHKQSICDMYNDIISALKKAGEAIARNKTSKCHQLPGWNNYCAEAHAQARDAFLYW